MHPVAVQLLYNRGLTTAIEIYTHLADRGTEHDPALLPDLPKAAARLAGVVRAGEPVGVYGDFDVDGLTGAAVMDRIIATTPGMIGWPRNWTKVCVRWFRVAVRQVFRCYW